MENLRAERQIILSIAKKHGASNVRVFGSVCRGEDTNNSDIDFLVDFDPDRSLFDVVRLKTNWKSC
jgi:predicted nucleotidyltransferase